MTVETSARRMTVPRSELLLPIVLAVIAQGDVWAPPGYNLGHVVGPAPVVALLYTVTSLALVWRKQLPLGVLAFIVTADAVEYLAFGAPEGLGALLPTVVAFYAVGRYASTGSVAMAAPLVMLGIAVHELTDPAFVFTGSNAVFYLVLVAAWPLGQAFRRRAADAEVLTAHVRSLAAERDVLAREAVAAERARIARELHDVVGHGLSVVVLQLVGALGLLDKGDGDAARNRLGDVERSARQALAEMRRLLGLLDTDDRDASLTPQPGLRDVERLVSDTRRAGADIRLHVIGEPFPPAPGVDLAAYRIVQESLTNVLKHARPATADVRIRYEPEAVVVEVVDQGERSHDANVGGRGIAGMRERVALYDGQLSVGPLEAGGFSVSARLPVRD